MPMMHERIVCPGTCPSVRSSAYESADSTSESEMLALWAGGETSLGGGVSLAGGLIAPERPLGRGAVMRAGVGCAGVGCLVWGMGWLGRRHVARLQPPGHSAIVQA